MMSEVRAESLRVPVGGWTAGGFAWPECRLPTCTTLLIGLRAVGELSPGLSAYGGGLPGAPLEYEALV